MEFCNRRCCIMSVHNSTLSHFQQLRNLSPLCCGILCKLFHLQITNKNNNRRIFIRKRTSGLFTIIYVTSVNNFDARSSAQSIWERVSNGVWHQRVLRRSSAPWSSVCVNPFTISTRVALNEIQRIIEWSLTTSCIRM
jgi:hypothetical protein